MCISFVIPSFNILSVFFSGVGVEAACFLFVISSLSILSANVVVSVLSHA